MRGSWFENDYSSHLILLDFHAQRILFELNNHRLGMLASVTFKRALIVVRLIDIEPRWTRPPFPKMRYSR
jgi:hypothetical protein